MRHYLLSVAIALVGVAVPLPAMANVFEQTEDSFVTRQSVVVPASPEEVWDVLVRPSEWWNRADTFSGDAANLSLHPRAGGCFCEVLPNRDAPNAALRGSVEHMRVVYAEDARALRMVGALGPMQADAVTGVLTIVLRPSEAGTRILWEYAVSGHLRKPDMAAGVDGMLTAQILRLAEKLGAGKAADAVDEARPEGEHASPAGPGKEDGPGHEEQSEPARNEPGETQSPYIGR